MNLLLLLIVETINANHEIWHKIFGQWPWKNPDEKTSTRDFFITMSSQKINRVYNRIFPAIKHYTYLENLAPSKPRKLPNIVSIFVIENLYGLYGSLWFSTTINASWYLCRFPVLIVWFYMDLIRLVNASKSVHKPNLNFCVFFL